MTELADLSPTDASNTSISGQSLDGNIANMANMDDTLQAILGMLGRWTSSDTVASAATTDIGAQAETYLTISGTTTITALGTVRTGTIRVLRFSGILTLTQNATSLILPGSTSITTAVGDTAIFVSEGSGNWRCLNYQFAAAVPARTQAWELISTQAPSAVATLNFTGLSSYRRLRLTGLLVPATNAVGLFLRTSTDNGSSYDAGASAYAWQLDRGTGSTSSATNSASATEAVISVTNVGNGAANGVSFEMILEQFNQTDYCWITGRSSVRNISDDFYTGTVFAQRLATTARNAVRLLFGSGNIASGFVTLEGIRS